MPRSFSMDENVSAGENEFQEPPSDENGETFDNMYDPELDDATQYIPPIDPSQLLEDDEDMLLLRRDLDEALAEDAIMDTTGREEDPPQPEPTPEQTARVIARPRKVPRLRAGPSSSRGPSVDVPSRQPTQQSLPKPANSDPSPEQLDPQSTAEPPKDKGKGKEVLFDVPTHERPLTREEAEGLQSLTTAQTLHLVERFRAQIAAESRRGHRDEFYSEMQEDMQLTFDRRLAEEKGKWAEEKRVLNETVRKMERDLHTSFSKGKENGEKSATAEHAARWSSMDSQLADKEKRLQIREQQLGQERTRLEGPSTGQTNVLATGNAPQGQRIAALTRENDRLRKEAAANVEELRRQLWEKEEEAKRVRAEMVTCVESLEQQLAAQAQVTTRVQNQLVTELRTHQEAMRASVRRQERREQALTQSHRDQLRQLRTEHWRNRYHPSVLSTEMDNDVGELAEQMSTLHIAQAFERYEASTSRLPIRLHQPDPLIGQMEDDRAPAHASSTSTPDGRLRQVLKDQRSSNRHLRQDLKNQKAMTETLRKSLADCQAKLNQPPVDNCAARLQELQECLHQKHTQELKKQKAQMMEVFRRDVDAFLADKDAELTKASATADEASRRSQEVIAGLEKDLETSRAEFEMEKGDSQRAKDALQALEEQAKKQAKEHRDMHSRLDRYRRELQAELNQETDACRSWSTQTQQLTRDLRRAKWTTKRVTGEARKILRAKEAAEAESSSLRTANRLLEEENKLKAESLSIMATINAMLESDQKQSENLTANLTAELEEERTRLAASEATIKKEAEEIHELENFVDGRLRRLQAWQPWEARQAEEGGREMDAPLGVSERANEGSLRPQVPWWKQSLFLLFVVVFFALVAAGYFKISADRRSMQRRLPEDPYLALSRGMYGVGEDARFHRSSS